MNTLRFKQNFNDSISGGAAGLLATFPMTALMNVQHRYLPIHQRHSLPPTKITLRLFRRMGGKLIHPKKKRWATLFAHYGYGAGSGALYPMVAGRLPGPQILKGASFGMLLWALSYIGWLPASGLYATHFDTKERQSLMITSHLVWGISLALAFRGIERIRELRSK